MKRLGWVLLAMLMMTLPLAAQQFGTVTGMVTFEDGNPIARAEVRILTGDHGPMHGLRTFTNPEGIYFFPRVPVGEFEMHAGLFRGPEAEATVVVTENEESVVDFVLAGDDGGDDLVFGSVSGTVASVDGEALAGAVVTITVADDRNHPRNLVNRTDDAGAFSFDEVPVGEWAIHAGFHGFARFEGTVAVLEGENTVMDIVLEAWDGGDDDLVFGSVVGTVGDVDGAGIAGAIVSINIQNDNDRHPRRRHIETRTDEFGAFAFEQVPVGEWGIVVFARDFQQFRGIVEVLENEETTVDVVLEAWDGGDFETGAVFGNVTDIDGLPVELARISCAGTMTILAIPADVDVTIVSMPSLMWMATMLSKMPR